MNTITSNASTNKVGLQIISYVCFTFIGYFLIGLPLAVLPIFISKTLGFSEFVAGIVISLQYLTTFLVRGYAGKIVDTKGPKPAVLNSMILFVGCGILFLISHFLQTNALVTISVLIIARLITGCAEGMVGASPINWAILKVGNQHTAKAISYNGVASYGGLALGAPLGVIINNYFGFEGIGILIFVVALVGYFFARRKENIISVSEKVEQSFFKVLKVVAPFGLGLMLAGMGFGGISNFITIYYDYFNWTNAALTLSVFSGLFILGRFIFSNAINKFGGLKVAIASMIFETIGLLILFYAPEQYIALIGSGIAGLGFSLVFPALGVEAVALVPDSNKGAALAAYGLFIDISLGITGPLVGGVISLAGIPWLFAFCAFMVFIGLINCSLLYRKKQTI